MILHETCLQDAKLIEFEFLRDERGFFARSFCAKQFADRGLRSLFVQQNLSQSYRKGTFRGLHYQRAPHAEAKLVRCLHGSIYDVIVDLRPESPTFRKWQGFELSAENRLQLYVPEGFAHGYQTLSDEAEVTYLVSTAYAPDAEGGLRHDDPAIGVELPLPVTMISVKDRAWPDFME